MFTTASFEKGSEFRVDWTTEVKNPKFNLERARNQGPHYKVSQDIVTSHKSEIFTTHEAAQAFKDTFWTYGQYIPIMVRRPGNKGFRPDFQTKTV